MLPCLLLTLVVAGCGGQPEEPVPSAVPAPSAAPADAPRVVAVDPPTGAVGIEPGRRLLSVTFDREMARSGWAWLRESPGSAPELTGEASFDASGRIHTVEAELEPGRTYVIWLNSEEIQHFRDTRGIPAVPFRWTFTTRRSAALAEFDSGDADPPRVVALEPPDGATGVDPSTATLQVTFDRPMAAGWSWVQEDPESFPETLGEPAFDNSGRIHTLPVRLRPETTYVVWLNSRDFQMFTSAAGVALPPQRWTFTTGPAR